MVFPTHWHGLAPVLWLAFTALAAAQPGPSARPDPLDPSSQVPRTVYRSPVAGASRVADPTPVPWREANDTVRGIGGWRAYAREAATPAASASMPASEPALPFPHAPVRP